MPLFFRFSCHYVCLFRFDSAIRFQRAMPRYYYAMLTLLPPLMLIAAVKATSAMMPLLR